MTMGPVPGHDTPHSNHCQQRHPGSLIIIVLLTFNTSTNIRILTQNKQSQTAAAGLRFGTMLEIEREIKELRAPTISDCNKILLIIG